MLAAAARVVDTPCGTCGTAWLQQTFRTLGTRGDLDFDDISRVVPWIETAVLLGLDLDAPQCAGPRGCMSRLSFDRLPPGACSAVSLLGSVWPVVDSKCSPAPLLPGTAQFTLRHDRQQPEGRNRDGLRPA